MKCGPDLRWGGKGAVFLHTHSYSNTYKILQPTCLATGPENLPLRAEAEREEDRRSNLIAKASCPFSATSREDSLTLPFTILRTVQVQPPWGPAWGRTVLNSQEEQSFSTSSKVQCIHSRVEVPYLQKHLIVLERGKEYYREVKKQNDMRFGTKSKWVWPERLLPWGA